MTTRGFTSMRSLRRRFRAGGFFACSGTSIPTQSRVWRLGEPFADVARRFAPRLRMPMPGTAPILRLLGITKSLRSPYDALMLQLHDAMKADIDYQARAAQETVQFPPVRHGSR